MNLEQSSTKQKILTLLKKKDQMTVAELSREMGITPMAVRQHLMALEKKNFIKYEVKKYGIGRPVFLYSLADKADAMFPKAYARFITEILEAVEKTEGKKKLDKIFKARKERLHQEAEEYLSGAKTFAERVSKLADKLEREGFMVELSQDGKGFSLRQFNCPLSGVPARFGQTCKYELELYRDLLGSGVTMQECQLEGDPACTYVIPKPTS